MGLLFNGQTPTGINFNGNPVNELQYNGVTVWTSGPDYSQMYLTFEALQSGTFNFSAVPKCTSGNLYYSIDNGITWINLSYNTNTPTITAGNTIMWKANLISDGTGIGAFSATGNFNAYGNIMSLLYGDNFIGQTELTGKSYIFMQLFYNNTKLSNAQNLILPATTLAKGCYCSMFEGCISLTTAPALPATTLASSCYSNMFQNCTSLVTASELPATTLANNCYARMFSKCTSLTKAPALPATTLVDQCYSYMFNGCTNLNYLKAMFISDNGDIERYTDGWVSGVAARGTFVKNPAATWNETGSDGVPRGWTVQNA